MNIVRKQPGSTPARRVMSLQPIDAHRGLSPLILVAFLAAGAGCGVSVATDEANATGGDKNDVNIAFGGDLGTSTEDAGGEESDAANAGDAATSTDDGGTADAGPSTACPGGQGCPCVENNDCDNSVCLETPEGRRCAYPCVDDCQKGYTCKKFGTIDGIFVCLPDLLTLCAPCTLDSDCTAQGTSARCLDYGADGRFCGADCKKDDDCPEGYACQAHQVPGPNQPAKQCTLNEGVCPCSQWAISANTKTTCSVSNAFGTCGGDRSCGEGGLGPCLADTPEIEVCDGADNDCDGKVDILPLEATCSVKAYVDAGSKTACAGDGDCPAADEGCDAAVGLCKVLIGECFGSPVCTVQGQLECSKVKQPKLEMCNGEDDDCDGQIDEDYAWVHPVDGSKAGLGTACGLGVCVGGTVKCQTLSKATCDSADKATDETCNNVDDDCDGSVDEGTCSDGSDCTSDLCDGATGKCSNPPAVQCDDSNVCTNDTCDAASGQCVFTPHTGSCSDGDACTVGDVCTLADGKPACAPGTQPEKCDDGNLCTDNSCDPTKGCVTVANSAKEACYGAEPKTENVGLCKGGFKSCANGVLLGECVGQQVPNGSEACDGKDDNCNGETDEGCKAATADVAFSAAFSASSSAKYGLTVEFGGSSAQGSAKGDKKTVKLGFVQWIAALWK